MRPEGLGGVVLGLLSVAERVETLVNIPRRASGRVHEPAVAYLILGLISVAATLRVTLASTPDDHVGESNARSESGTAERPPRPGLLR